MTSIHHGFGAVRFPLTVPGTRFGAIEVDAGLNTLTELISTALLAEVELKWKQVVGTLSDDNSLRGCYNKPIGQTLNDPPEPQLLTQVGTDGPILAVYRTGDPEDFELTLCHHACRQAINVDWILGPLSPAHQKRFRGFLLGFAALVREVVKYGRHPNYQGNVRQFSGSFHSLKVTGVTGPGIARSLETDSGGGYYAISVHLEAVEREMNSTGGNSVEYDTGYVIESTDTVIGTETGDELESIVATLTVDEPDE